MVGKRLGLLVLVVGAGLLFLLSSSSLLFAQGEKLKLPMGCYKYNIEPGWKAKNVPEKGIPSNAIMTWEKRGIESSYALAIETKSKNDFGMWSLEKPVAVKPNTIYVLTVHSRVEVPAVEWGKGLAQGGPPEVLVAGNDFYIGNPFCRKDWTLNEFVFRSKPEAKEITISLVLYHRLGQKVWFDNLQLRPAHPRRDIKLLEKMIKKVRTADMFK